MEDTFFIASAGRDRKRSRSSTRSPPFRRTSTLSRKRGGNLCSAAVMGLPSLIVARSKMNGAGSSCGWQTPAARRAVVPCGAEQRRHIPSPRYCDRRGAREDRGARSGRCGDGRGALGWKAGFQRCLLRDGPRGNAD